MVGKPGSEAVPANQTGVRVAKLRFRAKMPPESRVNMDTSVAILFTAPGTAGESHLLKNDGLGSDTLASVIGATYTISLETDSDEDGIVDSLDNCTLLANEAQLDTDGDGIGNMCDCDFNQDSFCGGPDFTIFVGCFNAPTNSISDCEAADMNGDGFVGGPDFTRFISGFNGAPGPSASAN